MFGRNRQGSKEKPKERSWRWRRREKRRRGRDSDKGREAFADFIQAIGNVARGQAFYFADRYRNRAADVVEDFAWSLRDAGERRDPDAERLPVLDDIADDLEDLSDVIRDVSLASALAEVEYLARRRPLVFGIGALAAGYLVTRATRRAGRGA